MRDLIIVSENSKHIVLSDLLKCQSDNIILMDYYVRISRTCLPIKYIRKFLCSNKVNAKLKIPYKNLWSSLNWFQWDKNKQYLVLFWGMWSKSLEPKFLLSLKEKYDINYAIFLVDCIASPGSEVSRYYIDRIPFEYIFTFDPKDAENYHYIYCDGIWSKHELEEPIENEYDLYYLGRNLPGRIDILNKICDLSTMYDCSTKFRLHGVSSKEQTHKDKIIYNQFISYDLALQETVKSNCILEFVYPGQSAPTQRYYEAICYNKKLLTNNKNVVNLPFYNPDYIHVFEKPEDIDWEWVKEHIPVDYHYDGRFSPTHLIDKIIELEERKEAQDGGEEK